MDKRVAYSPEEEEEVSSLCIHFYDYPLEDFLCKCFEKRDRIPSGILQSRRAPFGPSDLYSFDKYTNEQLLELKTLKRKLNSVKEKLNPYELNDWHRHTRAMNPADLVMRRLRSDIRVEFLTQAWCKFYEIVHTFNLIPKSAKVQKKLYTIHLCEAPGAFVASLNHYLKLKHPDIDWMWKANSLNPYYEGNNLSEMINDDRFMLQTIRNWDFGPDMTGDITHPNYPDYLYEQCGENLPHLVTADGSFDCQDRPEEQENSVSWLHLKETLMALRVLRKGGHFVLKMFTFFECDTVCLLYLLSCTFTAIDIFKPATSKEGNSEVYVVCREFKKEASFEPFLDRLLKISFEEHQKYAMFPFTAIPRVFLRSIHSVAEKFATIQISIIERNIKMYPLTDQPEIKKVRELVQKKLFADYIQRYEIRPIPLHDTIVRMPYRKNVPRHSTTQIIQQRDYKQGSHADQLKRSGLLCKELLEKIVEELGPNSFLKLQKDRSVMPRLPNLSQEEFHIRTGKPIENVFSSQFCHGTYIRIRNELISAMGTMKYNISVADVDGKDKIEGNEHEICDFTKSIFTAPNFNLAQLDCFKILYDRLATLVENENLILISFPLLTQFSISLLYVMGQFFQEIVFVPPNALYLNKVQEAEKNSWLTKLDKLRRYYDECNAVISFLPIETITGSNNKFYSWVIDVNHVRILHEIERITYYHLLPKKSF